MGADRQRASGRYLFVGLDYGGTWKPMLGLAGQLVDRGHAVSVLGSAPMRASAERVGCSFIALPDSFVDPEGYVLEDDWDSYDAKICGREMAEVFPPAWEGSGADVVVLDCLCLSAISAAEQMGIPAAVVVHFTIFEMLHDNPGEGGWDLPWPPVDTTPPIVVSLSTT